MKHKVKLYQLITAAIILPVVIEAQTSAVAKKIEGGKICDTCDVPIICNFGEPINYMIVGTREEIEYATPGFHKNINSSFPHLSTYFIASESFSLDFIAGDWYGKPLQLSAHKQYLEKKKIEDKKLQFSVLYNNRLMKNWTDINTLANDKNFQTGFFIPERNKQKFSAWENYHAGKFQLNVNDSLVVLIRSSVSEEVVESILLKRIYCVPHYYDFIKFPPGVALQDIMYGKFSRATSGDNMHTDSIDNYEMEPDEIIVLRFPDDLRLTINEMEYSFSNKPGEWQAITFPGADDQSALPGNYSIVMYKATPGETQEVLLRYKVQPESARHIKMHVKKKPVGTAWLTILLALGVATLLFAIWYAFKRRKYLKKIYQVILDKEETESKLQLLSGQLNPHFLFNLLNSIQNLINKNDSENANQYVSDVSSFLRTIMDRSKKEYISLEEELDMEEAYIKLEQKRISFTYRIIKNCDTPFSQVEFPPSLLQPIIENSIHHGFSKNLDNPLITIDIACNDKQLIISVADNGQGFNTALIKPGHGLTIVQKRISLLNERLSGMPVEMKVASTGKGTVTTFTFQSWL